MSFFIFLCLTSALAFGAEPPRSIGQSKQMLLVLTENDTAHMGVLYRFFKKKKGGDWQDDSGPIPVVIGRNGLGWGMEESSGSMPHKVEGDGKSPAGVFPLGACFGFAPRSEMKDLKIPYLHITEMTECIDDRNSHYYNKIIQRDKVRTIDWNSSEKMHQIEPQYKIGIIVNYNTEAPKSGNGSCIFLHVWEAPSQPTSGCTAMSEQHISEIANWLVQEKNPILVQLTKSLYQSLKKSWQLPVVAL